MNIGDVITTADELNALARYSVVVDDTGETWVKCDINMWVCAHGEASDADEVIRWHTYPLTVVALPSRPERVVKAEALREAAAHIKNLYATPLPPAIVHSILHGLAAYAEAREA